VALLLAVGWAGNWMSGLIGGERGWGLWWPLVSTVIWAGVAVSGFRTYHRIRTTTLPAITGRPKRGSSW
jgi:hypothetical protein